MVLNVMAFVNLCRDQYMRVGRESLEALQIVGTNEIHPNTNFSHSPNQLCISRLFEHNCKTACGRELLKGWMNRPLTDPEELETKWNMIDFLLRTGDGKLINELQKLISGGQILNVDVSKFNHRKAAGLINLIKSSIMAKSILEGSIMDLDFEIDQLKDLQGILEQVINPRQSQVENRIVINRGFHPHLDDMRNVFDRLEEILVSILDNFIVDDSKGDCK
jgi:DNA mismatch repair ATPase MutS